MIDAETDICLYEDLSLLESSTSKSSVSIKLTTKYFGRAFTLGYFGHCVVSTQHSVVHTSTRSTTLWEILVVYCGAFTIP